MNLNVTIEVPSFTDSRDMIGAKLKKKRHMALNMPIGAVCHPKVSI